MSTPEQIIDFSRIKATCSNCNLHVLYLPRGLNAEGMEKLAHVIKGSRPIQKGKHIFRANDPFVSFYAVRSGSVKVSILNESGEEQIIGFYFPGEILGFDAIEQNKHTCRAVAALSSEVKSGGSSVWGEMPMPPNPAAGDNEIEILVKWILSL